MIRGVKLLKLLEQNINNGSGVSGYRNQVRSLLGITESESGDPKIDHSQRAVHPKDFSIQEVAHTFLGHDYVSRLQDVSHLTHLGRLQEAEGHVVMPSHFANISAFSDTIAGLLDALVLEAYTGPEYIGESVFEVKEARVDGGKMIGIMGDGQVNDASLLDGEPYPSVGLKEAWVDVPSNERFGNVIQVNLKSFIYDRTDQLQAMATAAGESVARKRELRMADCFLGITNTYARNGVTSNTYRTTLGDNPVNYINSSTNVLTDWNDIDEAIQVLEGNTDPGTGFEISIGQGGWQMLISPQTRMNVETILQAPNVAVLTQSLAQRRYTSNPLPPIEVLSSRIWYNRLIAASVSASNAKFRWHLGLFKKAFQYRQIVPFQVKEAPLSSEDVRRDIVMIRVALEHGVPFVKEPRYSYRGTEE